MASLRSENRVSNIYLLAHHKFGRMKHSVDTCLSEPSVSRIHTIVEWDGEYWKVFDLSRNGTWLNGHKLDKGQRYTLKPGDKLNFGRDDLYGYLVTDVAAPCDYLITADLGSENQTEAVTLNPYNLLPNDERPEIALYLDYSQTQWFLEPMEASEFKARIVNEGEIVSFSNQRWKLCYNRPEEATTALGKDICQLQELHFQFLVSLDEESTQLILRTQQREIDLGLRSHHYLTLTLARQKALDIAANIDETEQGWIYTELLAKDLGLAETHINIQIHRARKQLIEAIDADVEGDNFIQRRGGKVRLGIDQFSVVKGSEIESTIGTKGVKVTN